MQSSIHAWTNKGSADIEKTKVVSVSTRFILQSNNPVPTHEHMVESEPPNQAAAEVVMDESGPEVVMDSETEEEEAGFDDEGEGVSPTPTLVSPKIKGSHVRGTFTSFAGNDGAIDKRELNAALGPLGLKLPKGTFALSMLRKYDASGDGALDVDEFTSLVRDLEASKTTLSAAHYNDGWRESKTSRGRPYFYNLRKVAHGGDPCFELPEVAAEGMMDVDPLLDEEEVEAQQQRRHTMHAMKRAEQMMSWKESAAKAAAAAAHAEMLRRTATRRAIKAALAAFQRDHRDDVLLQALEKARAARAPPHLTALSEVAIADVRCSRRRTDIDVYWASLCGATEEVSAYVSRLDTRLKALGWRTHRGLTYGERRDLTKKARRRAMREMMKAISRARVCVLCLTREYLNRLALAARAPDGALHDAMLCEYVHALHTFGAQGNLIPLVLEPFTTREGYLFPIETGAWHGPIAQFRTQLGVNAIDLPLYATPDDAAAPRGVDGRTLGALSPLDGTGGGTLPGALPGALLSANAALQPLETTTVELDQIVRVKLRQSFPPTALEDSPTPALPSSAEASVLLTLHEHIQIDQIVLGEFKAALAARLQDELRRPAVCATKPRYALVTTPSSLVLQAHLDDSLYVRFSRLAAQPTTPAYHRSSGRTERGLSASPSATTADPPPYLRSGPADTPTAQAHPADRSAIAGSPQRQQRRKQAGQVAPLEAAFARCWCPSGGLDASWIRLDYVEEVDDGVAVMRHSHESARPLAGSRAAAPKASAGPIDATAKGSGMQPSHSPQPSSSPPTSAALDAEPSGVPPLMSNDLPPLPASTPLGPSGERRRVVLHLRMPQQCALICEHLVERRDPALKELCVRSVRTLPPTTNRPVRRKLVEDTLLEFGLRGASKSAAADALRATSWAVDAGLLSSPHGGGLPLPFPRSKPSFLGGSEQARAKPFGAMHHSASEGAIETALTLARRCAQATADEGMAVMRSPGQQKPRPPARLHPLTTSPYKASVSASSPVAAARGAAPPPANTWTRPTKRGV